MFALRWLNAPDKPQIFALSQGTVLLGRGPDCDVRIQNPSLSKHHAQFQITADKVIIKDLNSTNGTYVNGVKIQHQRLRVGDQILIHQLAFDIVAAERQSRVRTTTHAPSASQWHASQAPSYPPPTAAEPSQEPANPVAHFLNNPGLAQFFSTVRYYFDDVAMPAIYRLASLFEFRFVLATMVALFVAMVTLLAVIPMTNVTRQGMESESARRALTLARYVEARNRDAVSQNLDSALDVALPHEEGVKVALIVAHSDGHILAPANKAGRYEDMPFVAEARQRDSEFTQIINSSTIGAAVPIRIYSAEQGAQVSGAHAIVIYDMGTLATDSGLIISLFVQVFVLSLLLGGLLYLITYRLIEHPIRNFNTQIDEVLRSERGLVTLDIKFPVLQTLCDNVNSALSRMGQGPVSDNAQTSTFLATDVENLVHMTAGPAFAVRGSDETIMAMNPLFENLVGLTSAAAFNQPLDVIIDQALRKNLQELIAKSRQSGALEIDQLEMVNGEKLSLQCKAISIGNTIGFYFIVLQPVGSEVAA